MAGGWYLIFGSFAARFCEKNITLPPCYFASSSMQITLGHHQQKVPHPPNKIDQQNNFLYVSPLFTSKKHPKKVAFLVNLLLWLPLRKKKKSPRSARARIRIQRGSRRCSTWYLDLCPLAPRPPIPSLRYLKGPWSIFDTVVMGISLGFERLSQLGFFRIKPRRKPFLGLKVDINPSREGRIEEDFGEKNQHLENWISFETLWNWCVCHISTIASYKDDHRKKKKMTLLKIFVRFSTFTSRSCQNRSLCTMGPQNLHV